jgi:hypothetical protein
MRPKAAVAACMALATIHFCAAPLLAKPTRTLARPGPHKLVATQPAPHLSHERAEHPHSVEHPAKSASARTQAGESADLRSSRHARPRTLAEERAFAARSAIAAADRNAHLQPHNSHSRHYEPPIQVAAVAPLLRHRETAVSPDFSPSPDQFASRSTALTNVGGVLRPAAPGTVPSNSFNEEEVVSTPVLLPKLRVASLYDNRGRLIMPAPLYGSREILLHQNEMADHDGLDRVRDDADLLDLRRERKLVALPDNETLRVDYRLPENRRFSRPWTAAFLTVLAADFYSSFHAPLQVDSAVRTVEVQQRLLRTNGNAAPVDGDTASPHLTGQAVDIAKGNLSRIQVAWLRTYLQPLIDLGKIDVEEEFQQSCFHISVYKSFLPSTSEHLSVATRQPPPESLTLTERPTE